MTKVATETAAMVEVRICINILSSDKQRQVSKCEVEIEWEAHVEDDLDRVLQFLKLGPESR